MTLEAALELQIHCYRSMTGEASLKLLSISMRSLAIWLARGFVGIYLKPRQTKWSADCVGVLRQRADENRTRAARRLSSAAESLGDKDGDFVSPSCVLRLAPPPVNFVETSEGRNSNPVVK